MTKLICTNCKYRFVQDSRLRKLISCSSIEKQKGFYQSDFDYSSSCSNYEKEDKIKKFKESEETK